MIHELNSGYNMMYKKKMLMQYMMMLLVVGSGYGFLVAALNDGEGPAQVEEPIQNDIGEQDIASNDWQHHVHKLGQGVASQFLWSFFMSPAATVLGKERKSGNSNFVHVLDSPELNSFVRDEAIKIKQLIQQRIRERMIHVAPAAERLLNVFTAQVNAEQ